MIITREWLKAKLQQMEELGIEEDVLPMQIPANTMRAKMSVSYIQRNRDSISINAGCVYSSDPKTENKVFSDATPSGNLNLMIDASKPASRFLESGDVIYVDITIAERNPWNFLGNGLAPHDAKILVVDDWENPTVSAELKVRVNQRSDQRPTYADALDADGNVVVSTYPNVPNCPFKYWRYADKA